MEDPVYLCDKHVLDMMLASEARQVLTCSYFEQPLFKQHCKLQAPAQDFSEDDRKILAIWMRDVCEAEECQPDVFPLSMLIVDKFLSSVRTKRCQLQLLGAVCLLLASKLRQTAQIPARHLIYYTQDLITLQELLSWELFVLTTLKWDLSFVTPVDYLDIFIRKLKLEDDNTIVLVETEALQMIVNCSIDFQYSLVRPSVIAWVCLRRALDRYELGKLESHVELGAGRRLWPAGAAAVPAARICSNNTNPLSDTTSQAQQTA